MWAVRHRWNVAGAAIILATGQPAAAQTGSDSPAAGPNRNDIELPAVIVTARRRAEDAQAVPGSLSVVGGDLLDRAYTVNTQGLAQLVPALNYSSANPRNTAFTIRGLGSSVVAVSQSNDGLEPGVGFYVDQVYHARPATAAFDFSDIEQVEVLRGPQGTLFGKNTTAGAISISSRAPSFTPGGEVELSYGKFDFVQAKAAVTGPVFGDRLAFRLSAVSTRRDGVIRNVATGEDENRIGNQAVRGQLLFTPSQALRVRLIADFTSFDSTCCTQVPLRVGQSQRGAARQYPALAAGLGYTPASTDPYHRVTDIDARIGSHTNEGGVSTIADWTLGPVTLTNVAAWRFWNWDAANDRDYTGIPIQLTQHIPSRQEQVSEELRLASNRAGAISYVGGLYAFRQRITGNPISIYGPQATYWLLGPAPVYPDDLLDGYGTDGRTDFHSTSYAGFGEVNWRLLPGLTATGGLRYTWETKNGTYATRVFGGLAVTDPALSNAKLSILRPQTYAARDSDGSLSGRANLALEVAPGLLGYASYARGAKSGGINMSGLPLDAGGRPALGSAVVRPERNTTYELGAKMRLLGRRLVVNVDAFAITVRDYQATVVDTGPTQTAALRGYLSNIPKVTVRGVEADTTALVARGLTLRASLAFADGRYADYPAGPCPLGEQTAATTACDLTGRHLSSLPRVSVAGGADYDRPVGAGAVFGHIDTQSRSGFNGDPSLSRYSRIGGYTVVNASLGYRFADGVEAAAFARNLFDADYIQNLTIQAGNSGLIVGTPSDPATYGVTLRFRR
jgi:iron complex outermembrane receptor protein